MSWIYRQFIRPVLFTRDAEQAHDHALRTLAWASRRDLARDVLKSFFNAAPLPFQAFGLRFPNPIGLAAGMDKYAEAVPAWEALGFGFVELGGVTWHAQEGNPLPRLFRIPSQWAIINRMGFNNPGAQALAQTLAEWRSKGRWPGHPVGINLGKSKRTPLDQAAQDYANSFRVLRPYADFFVVNVSSPNTPGLRQLQEKAALDEILEAIQQVQTEARTTDATTAISMSLQEKVSHRPVLVKVSPDLTFDALDQVLELVEPHHIAGIVATNTTTDRPSTSDPGLKAVYAENGGLSGRPVRARSTEIIRHLYRQTRGRVPIIGSGGVFNAVDAWEKITAGASLIQLYTGLIYEGPGIARAIVNGLTRILERYGLNNLQQAIGSAS